VFCGSGHGPRFQLRVLELLALLQIIFIAALAAVSAGYWERAPLWAWYAGFCVSGFANQTASIMQTDLQLMFAPRDTRSLFFAVTNMFSGCLAFLPVLGGAIYQYHSGSALFGLCAVWAAAQFMLNSRLLYRPMKEQIAATSSAQ